MNDSSPAPRLLPHALYKSAALVFSQTIPLCLLLAFNLFVAWLLHSEMSDSQQVSLYWILGGNVALLLLSIGWTLFCKIKSKEVSLKFSAASLLLQIGYLYLVVTSFASLIPAEAALWMIQPERWMGLQFTLMMPGLFYVALRLACFPINGGTVKQLGISLGVAIGVPVLFYLVTMIGIQASDAFYNSNSRFFSFLGFCFILFSIGATVIALIAILRMLALVYRYTMASKKGILTLTLVSALIAPIAGLLLNQGIPFPADFQHPAVYIMTVLNAGILLLPVTASCGGRRLLWFLLWLSFPFTLYFFLVFLPWLPLSLFAMIAAGAGFLILAPTVLMILHTLRMREVASGLGLTKCTAVLLAVLGLSIIPSAWTLRAISHRNILDAAITYTFRPGLEDAAVFPYNPKALKGALENLNEHYEGKYIPYLTDAYDSLVFNGMTLPKKKMQYMHQIFFGESLGDLSGTEGIWGMSRNSRMRSRVNLGAPPPKDALLKNVEWTQSVSNGVVQLEAELVLHNPTSRQVEYELEFDLPPGVWVNGYWLEIEGEKVPGMLVERKTAEWIYRMIRDAARRDPGLLRYMDKDTLELRVYPFAANETRRTGIRFTYPVESAASFSLGEFAAPANPNPSSQESVSVVTKEYNYFGFNAAGLHKLPSHTRKPYLHLLVDSDLLDSEEGNRRISQALAEIPESWKAVVTEGRIAALDYEARELTAALLPLAELEGLLPYSGTKNNTGLFVERGITHALRIYHDGLRNKAGKENVTRYPIVCIITDKTFSKEYPVNIDPWTEPIPEWQSPWVFYQGQWLEPIVDRVDKEVALFKHGQHFTAIPVEDSWVSWWSPRSEVPLQVMSRSGDFETLEVAKKQEDPTVLAQHESWAVYRDYLLHGAEHTSLREVIETSRDASVLLPPSSYIVLENEAQWKMLKLKEQQKLSGSEELELYKTSPEPSTWILMLVGFALLHHHQRRKNGSEISKP